MATVKCPSCDQALEVESAHRDWTVRCPHCGEEFVPSAVDALPTAREADSPRRRDEDDDDRDPDRDRYDDNGTDERDWAREQALRTVAAPALWLEICGWITALASVGIAALCVILAVEMANNPPQNGNRNGDEEVLVIVGCCLGAFGVPYGIALAIGGRKMRNLSSHGWAMTASVLGMGGFALCGLAGVIHTTVGVWALTVLNKSEVREGFGLDRRRRRRRRRDWDD